MFSLQKKRSWVIWRTDFEFLCAISLFLCVSVVIAAYDTTTTEAQRTQRLHTESKDEIESSVTVIVSR